jgi:16S rRNA (guanine966-N2)-methyltransferase
MFSMLTSMDAVEGATVLDLFAGSGALGIEALSRAAARATFVDHDRVAVAAIRANLGVFGEEEAGAGAPAGPRARSVVVCSDVLRYASIAPFADLILADPPYGFDGWAELLRALVGRTSLLVAETSDDRDLVPDLEASGWETVKVRRYGGTVVTVAQPVARSKPLLQQEGET